MAESNSYGNGDVNFNGIDRHLGDEICAPRLQHMLLSVTLLFLHAPSCDLHVLHEMLFAKAPSARSASSA
jgi:hypothetical protein